MIVSSVKQRELVTLDGDGVDFRGTYHKVPNRQGLENESSCDSCTAVVFLNTFSLPRAAAGNTAVHWASAFAKAGYPAFRFDLPSLGDSLGEIPCDLFTFIYEGGHGPVFARKIEELVERFALGGTVIFGHCTGATTAVYSASVSSFCRGLILLDPYFIFPDTITAKLPFEILKWGRTSTVGNYLRAGYNRLREMPRSLSKSTLPANANRQLIACWREVMRRGIPILVLRAPQPVAKGSGTLGAGTFDYLQYLQSFSRDRDLLTVHEIEGTDHSFADPIGKAQVCALSEEWLGKHYLPKWQATADAVRA